MRLAAHLILLTALAAPAFADDALVAKGKQIYTESRCSLCHSIAGKGNPKGPHDGVGSKLKPEEIRQWLKDPEAMAKKANATRKPPMASFGYMSEGDLDALVAYLGTLK